MKATVGSHWLATGSAAASRSNIPPRLYIAPCTAAGNTYSESDEISLEPLKILWYLPSNWAFSLYFSNTYIHWQPLIYHWSLCVFRVRELISRMITYFGRLDDKKPFFCILYLYAVLMIIPRLRLFQYIFYSFIIQNNFLKIFILNKKETTKQVWYYLLPFNNFSKLNLKNNQLQINLILTILFFLKCIHAIFHYTIAY